MADVVGRRENMSAVENNPPEPRRELTLLTKNPTKIVELGSRAVQDDLDRYQGQLATSQNRSKELEKTTMLSAESKAVAYRWLMDQIQQALADLDLQRQLHEYTYFNLSTLEARQFDSLRKSFGELLAVVKKQLQTVTTPSAVSAESR
jgi:hypothetical protein